MMISRRHWRVLVGHSGFGLRFGRLAEWIGVGTMNVTLCFEGGEFLVGAFYCNNGVADFGDL